MHVLRESLSGSSVGDISNPALPIFAHAVEVNRPHDIAGHKHLRGQLVYASYGTLQVSGEHICMLMSPNIAVWIPPHVKHTVKATSAVRYCSLFVDPTAAHSLPPRCLPVTMHALVKELALTAATFDHDYKQNSPESRLIGVLLDQLRTLKPADWAVSMPKSARLCSAAEALVREPGKEITVCDLAKRTHMSQRSFERTFKQETGLTFSQWRQRLQVQTAIRRLEAGQAVNSIAIEMGYQTTSAFIAMFRRVAGSSPKRYMAQMTQLRR